MFARYSESLVLDSVMFFQIWIWFYFMSFLCICMCDCVIRNLRWLWASTRVLRPEPWSSASAACPLSFWAPFPHIPLLSFVMLQVVTVIVLRYYLLLHYHRLLHGKDLLYHLLLPPEVLANIDHLGDVKLSCGFLAKTDLVCSGPT